MIMSTYSMTFTTTMCWNIEPAPKNTQNVLDVTLCDFIHVSGTALEILCSFDQSPKFSARALSNATNLMQIPRSNTHHY